MLDGKRMSHVRVSTVVPDAVVLVSIVSRAGRPSTSCVQPASADGSDASWIEGPFVAMTPRLRLPTSALIRTAPSGSSAARRHASPVSAVSRGR